ncbi:hypothetical protein [Methylacidimicrobium sp. B4]|uniref:hypothetical protein n=1 Tax=Methylacidimicrobium sp. B4 TaxID=2796139 RepID=UPI001A8F35CE|nr:hypothetical protein [Methylacidimicrobium sp. B4]QSR84187.1 hypothetical protein MacB4_08090 [Methylacidimicrobium sp. B4]
MERVVHPAILGRLSPESPEEERRLRELRRIHRLMGNLGWFRRQVRRRVKEFTRGIEIGPGDGVLGRLLYLDPKLRDKLALTGLDRSARPAAWPLPWEWRREDVREFAGWGDYPLVVANLVLHRFVDEDLGKVGKALDQSCRLLLAVEPARRELHLTELRLLRPFGLSRTAYEESRAAVRAGFLGGELVEALGLSVKHWKLDVEITLRGAYRLVAERH